MNTLLGKHWHHLPASEVLDLLDSDIQQGLDVFEIKHRQERLGFNVLTPKKGKSPLLRFLSQFNNPLVIILMIASLVTAVLKDPTGRIGNFWGGADQRHHRLHPGIARRTGYCRAGQNDDH